jgi:hypothetical protein
MLDWYVGDIQNGVAQWNVMTVLAQREPAIPVNLGVVSERLQTRHSACDYLDQTRPYSVDQGNGNQIIDNPQL